MNSKGPLDDSGMEQYWYVAGLKDTIFNASGRELEAGNETPRAELSREEWLEAGRQILGNPHSDQEGYFSIIRSVEDDLFYVRRAAWVDTAEYALHGPEDQPLAVYCKELAEVFCSSDQPCEIGATAFRLSNAIRAAYYEKELATTFDDQVDGAQELFNLSRTRFSNAIDQL